MNVNTHRKTDRLFSILYALQAVYKRESSLKNRINMGNRGAIYGPPVTLGAQYDFTIMVGGS